MPRWESCWSRCQSRLRASLHSWRGRFLAHEEEFLSGARSDNRKEDGDRELLPEIARHFVKQRIFAVDDFIVREGRRNFAEGVENENVSLLCSYCGRPDRGEIFQRVIHPTMFHLKLKPRPPR